LGLKTARRLNGYEPGPDAVELLARLRAGAQRVVLPAPPPPASGWCDRDTVGTDEAAQLLGCKPRNVRSLCARGTFATAEQRGRQWAIDRAEVISRAVAARKAARAALAERVSAG
jgi:hypothetical protein